MRGRQLYILLIVAALALAAAFLVRWRSSGGAGPQPSSRSDAFPLFVESRCASCHALADPAMLARDQWSMAVQTMQRIMKMRPGVEHSDEELQEVLDYYRQRSPASLRKLDPDPPPDSKLRMLPEMIGDPPSLESRRSLPTIANVNVVDLDQDGRPDLLVSGGASNTLSWIRQGSGRWQESVLAEVACPVHAEAVDHDRDGDLDVIVAGLGKLFPTDELLGEVVLLVNDGNQQFRKRTLLADTARVADVRPGDLDGDGDMDYVVGAFGYVLTGGLGWLEQEAGGEFTFHRLLRMPGAIHVPTVDLNGDGALDFVALVAQSVEQVVAMLNDGEGGFRSRVLYDAGTPLFGSTGIELVDLDRDGDQDVLYTNGDSFDLLAPEGGQVPYHFMLRPYHGVQWLENLGGLQFDYHHLARFYGAFRARAGDLDGDGDTDVVAVTMFNDFADPSRQSAIWLENDGRQRFTAHGLGSAPTHLATADLGDLDGDGRLDLVTGGMHVVSPYDRIGRVTWWRNQGLPGPVAR